MKPGSIYVAFTSEESLYLLALERYFDRSISSFRTMMDRTQSPLAGLASRFRALAQRAPGDNAKQACMLTRTLVETRPTEPPIVEKSRDYMAAMQQEFTVCFAKAIAKGELPATADPNRLARRFQANVSALRLDLARGVDAADVTTLAEEYGGRTGSASHTQQLISAA